MTPSRAEQIPPPRTRRRSASHPAYPQASRKPMTAAQMPPIRIASFLILRIAIRQVQATALPCKILVFFCDIRRSHSRLLSEMRSRADGAFHSQKKPFDLGFPSLFINACFLPLKHKKTMKNALFFMVFLSCSLFVCNHGCGLSAEPELFTSSNVRVCASPEPLKLSTIL